MATHLLNCPYCAGAHLHTIHHLFSYNVECCTCKAGGPRAKSEYSAVVAWNKLSERLQMMKSVETNDLVLRMSHIENQIQKLAVGMEA